MTQQDSTPPVPPEFGHWLAGFADGEGCFFISQQMSGRGRSYTYAFRFSIKLRADDIPILREIRDTTGLGRVTPERSYDSAAPQASWHVYDKRELRALVALFDRYPLRAKKARDFAVWRQAVIYWQQSGRRSGRQVADWGPVPQLWAELRHGRAYEANDGLGVTPFTKRQLELSVAVEKEEAA